MDGFFYPTFTDSGIHTPQSVTVARTRRLGRVRTHQSLSSHSFSHSFTPIRLSDNSCVHDRVRACWSMRPRPCAGLLAASLALVAAFYGPLGRRVVTESAPRPCSTWECPHVAMAARVGVAPPPMEELEDVEIATPSTDGARPPRPTSLSARGDAHLDPPQHRPPRPLSSLPPPPSRPQHQLRNELQPRPAPRLPPPPLSRTLQARDSRVGPAIGGGRRRRHPAPPAPPTINLMSLPRQVAFLNPSAVWLREPSGQRPGLALIVARRFDGTNTSSWYGGSTALLTRRCR